MAITITVKRYYGRFPGSRTTFANTTELYQFLSDNSITMVQYGQILAALGYNETTGAQAVLAGTITGEIILQQLALLS